MSVDTIIIGSDHGGYELKEYLKSELVKKGLEVEDAGTNSSESVDYPIYAGKVAKAIVSGKNKRGILICGTGIGISMAANRFKGVRAALCCTTEMASLTRLHNDSNVLVLGGRTTDNETASAILDTWLTTAYEGGRHDKRVAMIDEVTELD